MRFQSRGRSGVEVHEAVDRFGAAVAGAGGVEVGQECSAAAAQDLAAATNTVAMLGQAYSVLGFRMLLGVAS